jgi:hypothetical protein
MAISDFVKVSVALGTAPLITTEAFGVPLIAGYHTHWSQRTQTYATSSILATLVSQGFSVKSPIYLAAEVIAEQPQPPSQIVVGRMANKVQQSLTLTITDGLPADVISFTVLDSAGISHAIQYTIAPNPGSALAGSATTSVVNGSASVTFSSAQTLSKGAALVFGTGAQPGTYYFLSANVASSTSGTLTVAYSGTTDTTAPTTVTEPLTGTFTTSGSPGATIVTSSSQVGVVNPGDALMFASQPGVFYQVQTVTSAHVILTQNYTGTGSSTDTAVDLSTIAYQASQVEALIAAIPNLATNVGTVSVTTNVITLSRTDGLLTDIQNWNSGPVQNVLLANTTADPGVVADLTAIQASNTSGWYALVLASNSAAEVEAAQSFIDPTGVGGKWGFYDNADSSSVTSSTTDVFSELQLSSYKKCGIAFSGNQLLNFLGAAMAGYATGQTPGTYTLGYKQFTGPQPDTDTSLTESQALILNTMTTSQPGPGGKSGNYYKVQGGVGFLWPGSTPNASFVDTGIWMDWLQVNVQAAIFDLFLANPRVAYTQFGLGQIQDAIQGVYNLAFANGSADPTQPSSITLPALSSISTTSRQNRDLPGVSGSLFYSNAIQTVEAQITVEI